MRHLITKFVVDEDCWNWTACKNELGYGQLTYQGKRLKAHRAVWEWLRGPIPDGLVLDHLCRNPSCVNPAHLEAVTQGENVRRMPSHLHNNRRKTHCKQGHEFTPENTYSKPGSESRDCRICHTEACRRYEARKRKGTLDGVATSS